MSELESGSADVIAKPTEEPSHRPVAFHYSHTDGFASRLRTLQATLLVSTYQANKLLAIRATSNGLSTLVRTFERPMGIAANENQIALGTRESVSFFRNAPDLAVRLEPAVAHDACYLPRASHVTGDMGIHELAWLGDELWIVATRFSCVATLNSNYSFVPRWKPPFIERMTAEDQCHLNGIAVADGRVSYATALGSSDGPGSWRQNKPSGGVLMHVPSDECVLRNLSMPHSPRFVNGKLWVLESGTGRLLTVDPDRGRSDVAVNLPGFARGLAIEHDDAFVGLSRIRSGSAMDGVQIASRRNELVSGVAIVDLRSGSLAELLTFETAVEEVFDVQLIAHIAFPEIVGFQGHTLGNTFVLPPGSCGSSGESAR